MKCTYHWLKDFIDFDFSPTELAERLTMLGLEVDSYYSVRRNIQHAIVAEVVEVDSNQFLADIGDGKQVTVSATTRLTPQQKIVVVDENDRYRIATYKMLDVSEEDSVIFIDPQTRTGTKIADLIPESDTIYDIDLTPNRPDCLSIIGIAREIAAITGNKLLYPEIHFTESEEKAADSIRITIEIPEGCPRYGARIIKNIRIAPSPLWLHDRLAKVGLRAINNIVDVTNYVMLEFGHPQHAFDYNLISGKEIQVRLSKHGERFSTLDGKVHSLNNQTVMICDNQRAVGIGGIMGGLNSEVRNTTQHVLLECAYFNPGFIRKSSTTLNIATDSSVRFSRGVDPNGIEKAINRAAQLMQITANGTVLKGIVDEYVAPIEPEIVTLRVKRVQKILGISAEPDQIITILKKLGCEYVENGDSVTKEELQFKVPTFRPDLTREIDLIEELSRVIGFDKIPAKTQTSLQLIPDVNVKERYLRSIRDYWCGTGFYESISNSMIPLEDKSLLYYNGNTIQIQNPISEDMAILRPSLISSLIRIAQYNLFRQQEKIRLFEIGNVFVKNGKSHQETAGLSGILIGDSLPQNWHLSNKPVDFYDVKGLLTGFFNRFGINDIQYQNTDHWSFDFPCAQIVVDGKSIAQFGKIKKEMINQYDIQTECYAFELSLSDFIEKIPGEYRFHSIPKFPEVRRDLAFVIDLDVLAGSVVNEIKKWGGNYLKDIAIFDIYTGKQVPAGKKSIAISLTFQANERTLTENEINESIDQIISGLQENLKAELRS